MTAEQFCLRWNNHQSTLVSVFDGLFESGTLVDCTLAADGQYLKAHKVVLSACSPYLEAILSQHYNQHPIVILKDVKFEELKAMLEYMYRGEVNVTQEQLGRFLKAAETLKIKGLTNSDVGCSTGQTAAIATPSASAVVAASVAASNPVPPPTPAPNMVGAGDAREMPIRTRQDHRKAVVQPVQTIQPRSPVMGNQTSLVETLKNAPASLVIDIPPISPVNSKEGSISPTPRKRRKRKQSQNDESVSNVENNLQQLNSDVHSSTISERSNESVVDVDPLAILETGLVKPEVKMECGDGNDDENDSEGELTMDEDYDASCSKAGPSNGASSAADCHAWQGAASDDGENAESSKGKNYLLTNDTIRILRIKQRRLIRHMTVKGFQSTEIYKRLLSEFGQMAFSKDSVWLWIDKFRSEECSSDDYDIGNCPSTSQSKIQNLYKVHKEKFANSKKENYVDGSEICKILRQ
ncbi:uncharacterized protein LOC142327116 isoform X2 [Lycorma delicatula]|uniref:uncharacterized protein LOC142327116 isoform X2 n=1 Tax=Lycorma delicatula TaxID=130591 RepID=UPI003F5128E9